MNLKGRGDESMTPYVPGQGTVDQRLALGTLTGKSVSEKLGGVPPSARTHFPTAATPAQCGLVSSVPSLCAPVKAGFSAVRPRIWALS